MKRLEYLLVWGLYLFIFLLPWQTRLIWHEATINGFAWEYGRFSLYGTQLLLWGLLLLYGVWLIANRQGQKFSVRQLISRLEQPAVLSYWLLVGLVLLAGLSIFWALDSQLAYYRWFVLLQAGALLVMVLHLPIRLVAIATVWVAAAAIQGFFATWQFFNQVVHANKWLGLAQHLPSVGGSIILDTDTERWLRAYGSLPHPNILAGFLLVGFIFLVYLALRAERQPQRIFVLISLFGIIPALFLTFSRSAWLAFFVVMAWWAIWLYYQRRLQPFQTFLKIIGLSSLIIIILTVNLFDLVSARLLGQQAVEVSSIELRFAFTDQALTLIEQRPGQGTGIGNYTLGVFQTINSSWPGYYYQPVHNIFLLVLAELGIGGLALFVGLIGGLLWSLYQRRGHPDNFVLLLSLGAFLIIGLFDHYFWTLEVGVMIFWLILALNIRSLRRLDSP